MLVKLLVNVINWLLGCMIFSRDSVVGIREVVISCVLCVLVSVV